MAADRTIEVARAFQLQGRTAEAESLYREVLATQPNSLEALEGLGVLVFQRGNAEEASAFFGRGVAIAPSSARFHANLGEALRTIRRHDEALQHLRRAASLDPADVQAWNSLGLVAFDVRRYAAAEHAYREAIRLQPRFVHAHINLANTLLALGQTIAAADAARSAVRIEPNNVIALVNLGRILCDMRDPGLLAEAEAAARLAVTVAPQLPVALLTLARILRLEGRVDLALEQEQRASKLDFRGQARPDSSKNGPVRDDSQGGRTAQASSPLPLSEPQVLSTKGLALITDGQLDQAEACLREALRLDSTLVDSWVAIATIQTQRGDLEQACQSARAALAIRPNVAEAYWLIASNLRGRLADDEVSAIERLALDDSLTNEDRGFLHFALAMVLDQRGLYTQAAAHYDAANVQQSAAKLARGRVHNPDRHSRFIDQIITYVTPEFLARGRGWGVPNPRPVFVVGFPRSGTTLIEQILASHPCVHGAGELTELNSVFQSLPTIVGVPAADTFDAFRSLGSASMKEAAGRYLAKLDELAPATAVRVVDKMPDNVMQLGLIALLFPEAKVILCHRDPRDIAVSCWQTGFRSSGWNNNWDHIARRLADHQRLVQHWRRVQPVAYLDLQYEDVVTDPERHARRLIDFVGLDWNAACLEFHSNKLVVRTPSRVQVRQPIHSRSCGRWRLYEAALEPMFQAFERHGVVVG
jgi:tetratricopeptide (TPR) repeat protein